ncbi:hypothetical protein MY11210_006662 [Beauveria gryllotalpidicola]
MPSTRRNNPDQGCDEPATSSARIYVCATCEKHHQRNTHLGCHKATHAASGKFCCIYCAKEFGRGPSSAEGIEDTSFLLINALQDVELCTSDATYQEPFHAPPISVPLSATNVKRVAATFFRLRGFEAT